MTADLNALNALKTEAVDADAELDAMTAPPAPEQPAQELAPEPALSPIEEARGLVDLAVTIAAPIFPSLERVYTDDARDRLARVAAPLLAKYGMSVSGIFTRWKEEIDFAFVALPLVLQTVQAIKADRAAKEQEQKDAEAAKKGGAKVAAPVQLVAPEAVATSVSVF